jgi:hypothetical protein
MFILHESSVLTVWVSDVFGLHIDVLKTCCFFELFYELVWSAVSITQLTLKDKELIGILAIDKLVKANGKLYSLTDVWGDVVKELSSTLVVQGASGGKNEE